MKQYITLDGTGIPNREALHNRQSLHGQVITGIHLGTPPLDARRPVVLIGFSIFPSKRSLSAKGG